MPPVQPAPRPAAPGFVAITKHVFEAFVARLGEWGCALCLFGWGIILYLNETLFAEQQSYAKLAEFASQEVWAFFCLALGFSRLVVLFINGAWRKSPHLRLAFAFVTCAPWTLILLGLAPNSSTGLVAYSTFLFLDIGNTIRAAVDAKTSDVLYRRRRSGEPD